MMCWKIFFKRAFLIELLILILLIIFLPSVYFATPCSLPDFFHPFGTSYEGVCIQVQTKGMNPLIFLGCYILIATLILWLYFLLTKKK